MTAIVYASCKKPHLNNTIPNEIKSVNTTRMNPRDTKNMKMVHNFRRAIIRSLVMAPILLVVCLFLHDVIKSTHHPRPATVDCNATSDDRHQEMHDICKCPRAERFRTLSRRQRPSERNRIVSTCDAQATARGFNQTVVSYSFYGNISSDYFQGVRHNAVKVARMYPGYVMRVYHNLDVVGDDVTSAALCDLWCGNDHVDLCDVRHLPPALCDQHQLFGMLWRFLVLGR